MSVFIALNSTMFDFDEVYTVDNYSAQCCVVLVAPSGYVGGG